MKLSSFPQITALCALLLVLIMFTSCASDTAADRSPSTPSIVTPRSSPPPPCAAPCWYGLEVDKSTGDEVMARLQELPFVVTASIQSRSGQASIGSRMAVTRIYYDCVNSAHSPCGAITVVQGTVKEIDIKPTSNLALIDLVSQYGPPGYVTYYQYGIDAPGCAIYFNWPERLIVAESVASQRTGTDCNANQSATDSKSTMPVDFLHYVAKDWFDVVNHKA